MVSYEDIAARVEKKISEFMHILHERHRSRLTEAEATGEESGTVDAPELEQEHEPSPERRIAQAYEQDRAEAAAKFLPSLETACLEATCAERELTKTDAEWTHETNDRLEGLEAERDERLRVATDGHTKQRTALEVFINDQIQAPFNAVKKRLAEAQRELGRIRPDIWLKSTGWYLLLLALIGLCEFPLNVVVFAATGANAVDAYLMAGMLVLAIPFAAHFSGILLKRRHGPAAPTVNVAAALGIVALVLALSYKMADLRAEYILNTTGLTTSIALFVLLSVLLYGVATLLSYGHHADNPALEAAWNEHAHAETRYRTEKTAAEERRLALITAHETTCQEIHTDFTTAAASVRNRRAVMMNTYPVSRAYYKAMLAALSALEKCSHAQCLETIQVFRSANVQARRNQAEPACFQGDIDVASSYLDTYKQLDPPRHLVPA